MTRKKSDYDGTYSDAATDYDTPTEEVQPAPVADAPSGPVPGTVFIENRVAWEVDITLLDGTHVAIGPKLSRNNVTKQAIPKKLLPPHVRRLEREGTIRLIEAAGR